MTTLLLIRHGESEANRHGIFAGQINPDLQEEGVKQAELTAEYIAENYKVDKVYASDLTRAYRTGECVAKRMGLSLETDKNLREINAGDWEGVLFTELPEKYPEDFNMWMTDMGRAHPTNGESVRELGDRVMAALTKIALENDGSCVAVATHATPIRAVQSIMETGSVDGMSKIHYVSNASVTILTFDGEWKLEAVGIDEHLGALKTALPTNF